jgi:hypothetical protein
MGSGESFAGVTRSEHEADFSPPSTAEIKSKWSYTFTPTYDFMTHRDLAFTLLSSVLDTYL